MQRIAYRPAVDGLRAVAVAAVVLQHAGFGPAAGFAGVDVFFVISGYLITALLRAEWDQTARFDGYAFYARRARRLLPALIVAVAATLAASAWLLDGTAMREVSRSASAALLFVANLFFQGNTGGYFDPSAEHFPLLHLWSLGVEEQFYLVWPLLILSVLKWRPRALVPVLGVLAVLSFAMAEITVRSAPNFAFFQMPARFWELACGGLAALIPASRATRHAGVIAMAGLATILAGLALTPVYFPASGALPVVLGSALLLYAQNATQGAGWAASALSIPPLRYIGRISYSLYLWHWPLLALARLHSVGGLGVSARIGCVAAALLLASATFHFIEAPLRRPDGKTSDRRWVGTAMLLSAAMAMLAWALGNLLYSVPLVPPTAAQRFAEQVKNDAPENLYHCHYPLMEALSAFPKAACVSAPDKPQRVAIWGDSYAIAWQPLARAIAARDGVAAVTYSRSSCLPALHYSAAGNKHYGDLCREFNDRVAERLDDVDTLILAAHWHQGVSGDETLADTELARQLRATISQVLPHVRRLILLGPTPQLRDSVPTCIEREALDACAISRDEFHRQAAATRGLLTSMAAGTPKIEYLDLEDFFCPGEQCPAVRDGYGLYWDDNHVSASAAAAFSATYLARPR